LLVNLFLVFSIAWPYLTQISELLTPDLLWNILYLFLFLFAYTFLLINHLKECSDLAPEPLVWNIIDSQQTRGKMISASMIFSCPMKSYLELNNDYYLTLEDLYWGSFRGSLRHLALARYGEIHKNLMIEKRFKAKVGGIDISGQIDAYDPINKILWDWKTAKFIIPKNLPYGEHVSQTAIYRLLLESNGLPVSAVNIIYLDSSGWASVELTEKDGFIKYYEKGERKTASLDAHMQSVEKTCREIEPRIKVLHNAFHKDITPPSEPSFLCDLNNRERKSYCPVRHICPYWNEELREKILVDREKQMALY